MPRQINKIDCEVLVDNVWNTLRHYELRLIKKQEYLAAYENECDVNILKVVKEMNQRETDAIHNRIRELYSASRMLLPFCAPEKAKMYEDYAGNFARAHNIEFGSDSPLKNIIPITPEREIVPPLSEG